jgi:uncharacterized protein (TIGR02588 family)
MSERGPAPIEEASGPDWLERLATALSALLVLAVVSVLVWDAAHPDRPPALEASAGTPHPVGNRWHVPINVRNGGDVAVQDIAVSVTLEHPDTTVRDIDIHIDWLPGRSEREIDAVFAVDPSRGRLSAAVQSFDEP